MDAHLQRCPSCQTRVASLRELARLAHWSPSEDGSCLGWLAHYVVLEEIDRGGMGIVFRGRDDALGREVAIKMLAPSLAVSEGAKQRFLREAQAAAALEHPHIIPVYLVEREGAIPYFVMAYNQGSSLEEWVATRGPLPLEEIRRIGIAIAEGLRVAHARGLVHRDVKPANILLSEDGEQVRITDFGLARLIGKGDLTQTGSLAGSPHYMAPEQVDGNDVDAHADLFSLGGVLYFMATGRPAFEGPHMTAILKRVSLDSPAPFEGEAARLPSWFQDIVWRLLEKVPGDRLPSAHDVVVRLRERRAPKRLRKVPVLSRRILLASLALIALVSVGLVHWMRTPPPPPSEGFSLSSSDQIWASLGEAVVASLPGDTITIHESGVVQMDPLHVRHPLRIRAGAGETPEFRTQGGILVQVEIGAALTLEGLTLAQYPQKESNYRPMLISRSSVLMTHCRCERIWRGKQRLLSGSMIHVDGGAFVARDSEFYAPSSKLIHHRGELLELDHCALTGAFIANLDPADFGTDMFVRLRSNNLLGGAAVSLEKTGRFRTLTVEADRNVFDGHTLLGGMMDWAGFTERLADCRWLGTKNLYACQLFLTSFAGGQPGVAYATRRLDQWEAHEGVIEKETVLAERAIAEGVLPNDYVMTPHRRRVEGKVSAALLATSPALKIRYPDRGICGQELGPGAAYKRWMEESSDDRDAWDARVAAFLQQKKR